MIVRSLITILFLLIFCACGSSEKESKNSKAKPDRNETFQIIDRAAEIFKELSPDSSTPTHECALRELANASVAYSLALIEAGVSRELLKSHLATGEYSDAFFDVFNKYTCQFQNQKRNEE